jgi:hypothetical protein
VILTYENQSLVPISLRLVVQPCLFSLLRSSCNIENPDSPSESGFSIYPVTLCVLKSTLPAAASRGQKQSRQYLANHGFALGKNLWLLLPMHRALTDLNELMLVVKKY